MKGVLRMTLTRNEIDEKQAMKDERRFKKLEQKVLRNFYVLDGHKPIRAKSVIEYANCLASDEKQVAKTLFDKTTVSTAFIGFNHASPWNECEPIVFETMVFGGDFDRHCLRYSSWEEAEKGHADIVDFLLEYNLDKKKIEEECQTRFFEDNEK
jgi:hypothetical protein